MSHKKEELEIIKKLMESLANDMKDRHEDFDLRLGKGGKPEPHEDREELASHEEELSDEIDDLEHLDKDPSSKSKGLIVKAKGLRGREDFEEDENYSHDAEREDEEDEDHDIKLKARI